MNESKRAFVTGGGGYIGNCLCEALTARGYAVTAFDAHYLEREHHSDSIHRVKVCPPSQLVPKACVHWGSSKTWVHLC